jgi:hypothetical protein
MRILLNASLLLGLVSLFPLRDCCSFAATTCGKSTLESRGCFETIIVPGNAIGIDYDGGPCSYAPVTFPWDKGHGNQPTKGSNQCTTEGQQLGCSEGVPLDNLCNATRDPVCSDSHNTSGSHWIDGAVVTEGDLPKSGCVTDHYIDPKTGQKIAVKEATAKDSLGQKIGACVQQSEAGACGGVDCPCPGLFISETAFHHRLKGGELNPYNKLAAGTVPYISIPKGCAIKLGSFAIASKVASPGEDPGDWVGVVVGDSGGGGKPFHEVSSGLVKAAGGKHDIVFRFFPDVDLSKKWQWGTPQSVAANLKLLEDTKKEVLSRHCDSRK